MSANKYMLKLKLLLEKIFQDNFELDSYNAEKLLFYLKQKPEKGTNNILESPYFSDLVMYSLENLEIATTSVKIFILELITILGKNELQFSKFTNREGFLAETRRKISKMNIHETDQPLDLQYAGIQSALSNVDHYSGLSWTVQHKLWKDIFRPNIYKSSHKVSKASYDYVSLVVWKLSDFGHETALIELLEYVLKPIIEFKKDEVINLDNEQSLYNDLYPTLRALLQIVSGAESNKNSDLVMNLINKYFIVDPFLHYALYIFTDFDSLSLISNLRFKINFVNRIKYRWEMINFYYNIMMILFMRRKLKVAVNFASQCFRYMANDENVPEKFERNGKVFDFRNQFLPLLLAPILTYSYYLSSKYKNKKLIECIDVFRVKLYDMSIEHIVKAKYMFRELIETEQDKGRALVIQTLKEILKLRTHIKITQAGLLYQTSYYTLKSFERTDETGQLILNETPLKSPDDVKLISLLLDVITMLLKEHNIRWYENLEIISLQTTLINLLKQNFLPCKQLLQTLDLIDLSIKQFLSPDMALLIESKQGSSLTEIMSTMTSYITHEEWEVRDSALDLLLSCTEVAFVKYTPLQKLLSENRLLNLAGYAALNDREFYVQTTALKCLGAACKINILWKDVMSARPNLYIELINILKNNSEGIVRKEAANVLTEIFVNQKLTTNFTENLYNTMRKAATDDLDWEVQLSALIFWKKTIHHHMSIKGMIDGKFPSVTFSREKRKIIVLNEREILKQLKEMTRLLEKIGCFTVLHDCLDEDVSISVMEAAYKIAEDLVRLLDGYKFEADMEIKIESNNDVQADEIEINTDEAMDLSNFTNNSGLQDAVINAIVNTPDFDLLMDINLIQQSIIHNDIEENEEANTKQINTNNFIDKFKRVDFNTMIENKNKWISGDSNLESLIDELLEMYNESKFTNC